MVHWYHAMPIEDAPVELRCNRCGRALDATSESNAGFCPKGSVETGRFCAEGIGDVSPEGYAALERRREKLRRLGLPVNREGWEVYMAERISNGPDSEPSNTLDECTTNRPDSEPSSTVESIVLQQAVIRKVKGG